jgi:FtsP/CotA-like multicopper oxidase with cupredoxin domain
MKKANGRTDNHHGRTRGPRRPESARALPSLARLSFTSKVAAISAVVIFAAGVAAVSLSLRVAPAASAQAEAPLMLAQNLGSPNFANPSEIRYSAGENRLRGIIQIVSGKYQIPNVGTESLRQYRGSDSARPGPAPGTDIGPGPTLRARLGDQVQISFFNKADERLFPYSFDTTPKPGHSSFGCDKSGTLDPKTGTILPYPGNDKFPNCFHGSSTANIHFHGTHTSPDGLGDNVLVQVLPQPDQPNWTKTFESIFNSGKIPQRWLDLPADYRDAQMTMLSKHDDEAAAAARKNNLLPPGRLSDDNKHRIAAGEWPQYIMGAFPNFFDIPDYDSKKYKAGQAPGTHWYHAHKHGSTSLHILNGLAGAFVIESSREGGYDHFIRRSLGWGNSYGDHEKILVFQQFDPTQNLERSGPGGKGIRTVLVNGKLTPTITMRPGEIQLWRLVNATEGNGPGVINAGSSATAMFQTQGFTFRQTAQDGVQLSKANYRNQPFLNPNAPNGQVPGGVTLAGGNRVDFLVLAPTKTGVTAFKNIKGGATLFFVNVTGAPMPAGSPSFPNDWPDVPEFLKDLPAPPVSDTPNVLQFQWDSGRAGPGRNTTGFPPHFMINGKQFGEMGETVDQCMPLDGLQDWILENWTNVIAHPFHIHINPFQVIQIDTPTANTDPTKYPTYTTYAPKDNYVWQDVIAIPPAVISKDGTTIAPGRVRIRHKFLDFAGTFVLHCHILAHEDRGMMQLVRVVRAEDYPNGCQNNIPDHH